MKDYVSLTLEADGDLMHHGVKGMKWGVVRDRKTGATLPTMGVTDIMDRTGATLVGVQGSKKFDKKSHQEHVVAVQEMASKLRDPTTGIIRKGGAWDKYHKDLAKKYDMNAPMNQKEQLEYFDGLSNAGTKEAQRFAPEGTKALMHIDARSAVLFVGSPGDIDKLAKANGIKHSDMVDTSPASISIPLKIDENGFVMGFDDEIQHHGIKGMKWGVRNSKAVLRAKSATAPKAAGAAPKAAVKVETHSKTTAEGEHKQVVGAASGETSQARYARLAGQAKAGQAHAMSEQDLKFFNARTDALNKVNKMYEAKPNWLMDTAKDVAKDVAKQQMKNLLTKSIENAMGAKTSGEKEAVGAAVSKAVEVGQKAKTVSQSPAVQNSAPKVATSVPKRPGMTQEQSLAAIRAQQAARIVPPANYSPSGNFDLFSELKKEGLLHSALRAKLYPEKRVAPGQTI